MAEPKTVRVRMRDGLQMTLPSEVVRNSAVFLCTPETPIEVLLDHRFTRRRLECGDFVLVDDDPAALGLSETAKSDVRAAPRDSEPPFEPREDEPVAKRSFFGGLLSTDKE